MINHLQYFLIIFITLCNSSCNSQIQSKSQIVNKSDKHSTGELVDEKVEPFKYGAGDVVNKGYLDKSGNMWFATLKKLMKN